jgi:GTP-binding protein
VRRKAFARVSGTPGRTREINFFKVNDRFVLVDLPGYGYAQIAKSRKAEWKPLIEGYLRHAAELRGVVQLLDARHAASKDDLLMLDFLAEVGVPTIVALTKVDKLRPREIPERVKALAAQQALDEGQMIPFSATTDLGRDELAEAVVALVEQPSWRSEVRAEGEP